MKKDLILILPYFGKLPSYFDLFLQSCYCNNNVDILLFTDNDIKTQNNVNVERITWIDFANMIKKRFDYCINLEQPYKLCDFKPAYGYIFEKEIADYKYWGHCDCDLIFGDLKMLDKFINPCDNNTIYDRIGSRGHLMLYRNNYDVNRWFMSLKADEVPSFEYIAALSQTIGFDEFRGMDILVSKNNKMVCNTWLYDDIIFYTKNLYSKRKFKDIMPNHKIPMYYIYDNGKIKRRIWINGFWEEDDSLYVHLQKRKMIKKNMNNEKYLIVGNKFVDYGQYNDDELLRMSKAPFFDIYYHYMLTKSKIRHSMSLLASKVKKN